MEIYTKPSPRVRCEKMVSDLGFEVSVENTIDDRGLAVSKTVFVPAVKDKLKGIKASSFELDPIIASGSLDLLKEVGKHDASPLGVVDAVDAHLEYMSNLPKE